MSLSIEFVTSDDEGDDVTHQLPARYEVCSRCEGHGTHLNPSIGNHAFTGEEFEREFDEEQREQYLTRGGIYDVVCEVCSSMRVELVVDRKACCTEELKRLLALYDRREKERREDDADWAREIRNQELMGGMRE